jgi:hypothetical protein
LSVHSVTQPDAPREFFNHTETKLRSGQSGFLDFPTVHNAPLDEIDGSEAPDLVQIFEERFPEYNADARRQMLAWHVENGSSYLDVCKAISEAPF